MAFTANNGERKNVRMSEMIISLTDEGGGDGTEVNSSVTHNSIGWSTGFKLSYMYGRTPYNDSNGDGSDSGWYQVYNLNEMNGQIGSGLPGVGRFTHTRGRYRSATGAPTNSTVQTSGQINMANLTGISNYCLTTDPCGQTRGVKGGYTTNTTTKTVLAYFQSGMAGSNDTRKNFKPGIIVNSGGGSTGTGTAYNTSSRAGPGVFTSSTNKSQIATAMGTNIGYSAYSTRHTNQWSHLGLNTKLTTGDRVIVVAHGGGGNMYTFSSNGPIYLRSGTGGGQAVSATVTTLAAPHKNTTGSDDNVAVYSAVCNADGATMVGVNPFHSSAQPYLFHVFCIKGPNTTAGVMQYTTKYTQYETSTTKTNDDSSAFGFQTQQTYYISISSSPFFNNIISNPYLYTGSLGLGTTEGFDSVYVLSNGGSSSDPGTGFVTISSYNGGVRGQTINDDKYGFSYPDPIAGFYTPQYGRRIPSQDGRQIRIRGKRG